MTTKPPTTFSNVPEIERRKVMSTAQTAAFVGLSVPHLRRLYRTNKFPKGMQIGERKLGWKLGTLMDWVDAKNAEAA